MADTIDIAPVRVRLITNLWKAGFDSARIGDLVREPEPLVMRVLTLMRSAERGPVITQPGGACNG